MLTPRIIEANFMKSAPSLNESLDESRSEVAFLGRSNVGKSSTINGLTNRKNLAKSSATPGKTQLINFFDIKYRLNQEDFPLRFVDLPGFGYAKVSKTLKQTWQKSLVEFIQKRIAIRVFVHIRDARHPDTLIDNEVEEYIKSFKNPDQKYLTLFTKIDKLNQKERDKLKREFPDSIVLSNVKNSGHDRVHQEIFTHIFGVAEQ